MFEVQVFNKILSAEFGVFNDKAFNLIFCLIYSTHQYIFNRNNIIYLQILQNITISSVHIHITNTC